MSARVEDALAALRPGAEWTIRSGVIEWLDQVQTQPTAQEISDKMAALDAAASSEATRISGVNADSNLQNLLTQAKTATVSQIDTWISNNVTTLAQARVVLAAIVKYIATQVG